MRIAAYILSIIVVFLTIKPCIDKPEDNSVTKSIITQQTSNTHQNDIDQCSPFCTCQCCQTSFHCPIVHSVSVPVSIALEHLNTNQNLVNNFFFEFYIPPKV